MQQKILNILEKADIPHQKVASQLSFGPFMEYLRGQIDEEKGLRKEVLAKVLESFSQFPELEGNVPIESLPKYKAQLDMLATVLNPVMGDSRNSFMALSVPLKPIVFYGSDLFYGVMCANPDAKICELEDPSNFIKQVNEHFYSFILERFYGIRFRNQSDLTRTITDCKTDLTRHFKLSFDTRFVDVKTVGELPELDPAIIRAFSLTDKALAHLMEVLPHSKFVLSGFSIINIRDVTPEFALEEIKNNIVSGINEHDKVSFPAVVKSLKELSGTNDLEFNILPLYRVNGKLVDEMDEYCHSIIFSIGKLQGLQREVCVPLIEKFIANPRVVYFEDLDKHGPSQRDVNRLFYKYGVKSYALLPIYYNKKLVGALELYSYKKDVLNEYVFNAIQPAMSLLAQLVKNSLAAFDDQLETIIKDKFTSLQPSVQWKFNEVAWHYLQMKDDKSKTNEPEEIVFKDVFPLYGAVDIRNSTNERNTALVEDLKVQLGTLVWVLDNLKKVSGFGLLDEKIFIAQQWINRIEAASGFDQEIILNDFLDNDIAPFLKEFVMSNPEYKHIADEYFEAIDEEKGAAYENRKRLEKSMSVVISAVNNYFDNLRGEIQHSYPCYFEKFRTDGVEYDIYIGQSITPDKPYSNIYLQNLRLMQLRSMAAIANYSHSLQPLLSWAVQTTQLIFIHSHPIDIKFRRDEKRFDVEGAYNIRYHIIKKRIDKVRLKNSKERLTQPGKIALVYFSQAEAEEYISYIHYLQQEKILKNDLEYLELEELQGVAGLKALRVGVMLEAPNNIQIPAQFMAPAESVS
jgi:hypothetical protein